MANPLLLKNHTAETAVTKYRIVKHGSADGKVVQATAATDKPIGVAYELSAGVGERIDVVRNGIADVDYGGTVTRGDPLVSDANGKAVTAAPSAGSNAYVIGFAEVSGVAGDLGVVNISPSVMQG